MAEPGPEAGDGPVIFLDVGATLVGADVEGPASRIAARLGLDRERKHILREALMTTDFVAPEEVAAYLTASLAVEADAAARVSRAIWSAQEGDARALPGATEAVARLGEEGWRLGLISNIWRPYLVSVRRQFGALFDALVPPPLQLFSFQLGRAKPDPGVFAEALRRAGVAADRAVMVGDSYDEDIAPAAALGMETVWVLTRPADQAAAITRVREGTAAAPSQTIASLDALDPRLLSCADD
jgi:HAD superfamily hydrolase (TIGR01509 family)